MRKLIALIVLLLLTCKETIKITDTAPEKCIPKEEICNGEDDDCDNVIDNPESIGVKPCYSGNTNELLYGPCRFGVERCISGTLTCQGEIKPAQEICNGVDDNCNGQTDESFSSKGLDVIFVIDYSGSMNDKIAALSAAVSDWTLNYTSRQDLKFALVGAPPQNEGYDGKVKIISPLVDPLSFRLILFRNQNAGANGNEPTLDAIYLLSDPRNPLGINWTSGYTRAIFIFTDEFPQSYLDPQIKDSTAMAMANNNSVKVFVFSSDFAWRAWNPIPLTPSALFLKIDIDKAISSSYCR